MVHYFCFFEDLQNLRTFLIDTWNAYKGGQMNLMTASVTTNTAFKIVRDIQKDLIAAIQPQLRNYETLMQTLWTEYCFLHTINPFDLQYQNFNRPKYSPFVDFTYYAPFFYLNSFLPVIDARHLPLYNGQFGWYDPQKPRNPSFLPPRQFPDDGCLLLEILPEFFAFAKTRGLGDPRSPGWDELSKELCNVLESKHITPLAVFGLQIFLDIHHMFGKDIDRGYRDLHAGCTAITKDLITRTLHTTKPAPPPWEGSQNEMYIEQIKHTMKKWVFNDTLAPFKERTLRDVFSWLQIETFSPPPMPSVMANEVGLAMADSWGSILYTSHLYHAGIVAGELAEEAWKDMEWVMSIHGRERIFKGKVPKNAVEAMTSYHLMMGTSPVAMGARSGKKKGKKGGREADKGWMHSLHGPHGLEDASPVAKLFRGRFSGGRKPGATPLTVEVIGELLDGLKKKDRTAVQSVVESTDVTVPLQNRWKSHHTLSPLQLLQLLRASLQTETVVISFSYISLHTRSLRILRAIRDANHEYFLSKFGEGYLENESQLSNVVGWILMIISESEKFMDVSGVGKGARRQDVSVRSKVLVTACEIMREWIGKEGAEEVKRIGDGL
ncbi:hypothetical protein HK097_003563 [Rhizophlyctis rosea]|uniref:DUF6604 domain-containing protein n=1 Tax=Rhizophlyctis rosea TaxID=64517 RepID=A0AAD5SMC4_9FUNG|nr:hypothetical protein HK097_003563 [Rhizophlyctis rosea]